MYRRSLKILWWIAYYVEGTIATPVDSVVEQQKYRRVNNNNHNRMNEKMETIQQHIGSLRCVEKSKKRKTTFEKSSTQMLQISSK